MLSASDILALKSLPGIGDQTIRKLIKSNYSISDLPDLPTDVTKKILNSVTKDLQTIQDQFSQAKENAEYLIEKYYENSIRVISSFDQLYPANLKKIADFPILLFCKGDLNLLTSNNNIAIIGTRENSSVGKRIAAGTASYFAQEGFTIVSGLAKGIDAIAHEATLEVKGKTIAVLVDISKIYPKENQNLAIRIFEEGGLLLSENIPGSIQNKNAFVVRDRIQSGLSLAIFPIETDILGGTMHTVSFAKKQNRLIFVPDLRKQNLIDLYKTSVGNNFNKLNGIRSLIQSEEAFPYSKENYSEVKYLIERHNLDSPKGIEQKGKKVNGPILLELFSSPLENLNIGVTNNIVDPYVQVEEEKNNNDYISTSPDLSFYKRLKQFMQDLEEATDKSATLQKESVIDIIVLASKDLKKLLKQGKSRKKKEV